MSASEPNNLFNLLLTKPPWGLYSADTWSSNSLPDLTGNGRSATTSGVSLASASGNGAAASIPYLTGGTAARINWPAGSIPVTAFTICSMTRYLAGGANRRILTSPTYNFAHGHYNGVRGTALYKSAFVADNTVSKGTLTDWLVMCGSTAATPDNIMIDNGESIGALTGTYTPVGTLSVNNGTYPETSDFAFSQLIIWDQVLTAVEMRIVCNAMTHFLLTGYYMSNYRLHRIALAKPPWGIYSAEFWNGATGVLPDLTANGRHAATNGLTRTVASGNGASGNVTGLEGTTASTITWPAGSIPASNYTICSITRYMPGTYNGLVNGRVLQGTNGTNFIHGHWESHRGVAHYQAWITAQYTTRGTLNDWLIMCGSSGANPDNVIVDNGVSIGTGTGIYTPEGALTINNGYFPEPSYFSFSQLIIWDQALTTAEMRLVCNAFTNYLASGVSVCAMFAMRKFSPLLSLGMQFKQTIELPDPNGIATQLRTTGFTVNGVDISTIMAPYVHGASSSGSSGYSAVGGVDLGAVFQTNSIQRATLCNNGNSSTYSVMANALPLWDAASPVATNTSIYLYGTVSINATSGAFLNILIGIDANVSILVINQDGSIFNVDTVDGPSANTLLSYPATSSYVIKSGINYIHAMAYGANASTYFRMSITNSVNNSFIFGTNLNWRVSKTRLSQFPYADANYGLSNTISAGLAYTSNGDGIYTYLVFTAGTGTITFPAYRYVYYLVVGGGGGGGRCSWNNQGAGGGGGGGGVVEGSHGFESGTAYTITVGGGGATASAGNASVFSGLTATGGACGLGGNNVAGVGGLGGSSTYSLSGSDLTFASHSGAAGGTSGYQTISGTSGGNGEFTTYTNSVVNSVVKRPTAFINDNLYVQFGGGGGGGAGGVGSSSNHPGGAGGGGTGGLYQTNGSNGTANLGGGGGGGGSAAPGQNFNFDGGSGGAGVVVVAYLTYIF